MNWETIMSPNHSRRLTKTLFVITGTVAIFSGALAYADAGQKVPAPASAAGSPQQPPVTQKVLRPKLSGYLPASQPFDATTFLPPYPVKGSQAEAYDIAAWRETSKGKDSARWQEALADDKTGLNDGLTQFQCALGVTLSTSNAPTLMKLLGKVQLDGHWAVDRAKSHFKRPRPFAQDENAPICLPVPTAMRSRVSTAYPGGHSALGMSWGLVLAELAPDRSAEVLKRVHEYSQSRLVCGIHFPSDLEAGHLLAAGLIARLHAEQSFRDDLDLARQEVVQARQASTSPPATCKTAPPDTKKS